MEKTMLSGNWKFTQKWNTSQPYSFNAELQKNGTVSINNGQFFGTYEVLGSSNQIALAIGSFNGAPQSITSYVGNLAGGAMGGEATGASVGGPVVNGVWSAQQVAQVDENKGFHVPSETEAYA